MKTYKVKVTTGRQSVDDVKVKVTADTTDNISIQITGRQGVSKLTQLHHSQHFDFSQGTTSIFSVEHDKSLGVLLSIRLEKSSKDPNAPFWFPNKIEITSPEGIVYHFPIYQWIDNGHTHTHTFREGKALIGGLGDELPCRVDERNQRKEYYQWTQHGAGLPWCMKSKGPFDLPLEVRFSFKKKDQFTYTKENSVKELKLETFVVKKGVNWNKIDDIPKEKTTRIAEYVQEHWTEDAFFGYQYLNGVNPMLIRSCPALPDNFPVTNDMLSLPGGRSLDEEMKDGKIFLLDYKNFDGVKANKIGKEQQYLAAPVVLLHSTPTGADAPNDNKLMPVAIQLKQKPSEDNPIFLPTDSQDDWGLAKIYVRSADFTEHQLNFHLLRVHLLAEVFAVSLLRNVPMVHPLYKLLIPHTRYTLQINNLARGFLISEGGIFDQFTASGGQALLPILQKFTASLTYISLCPHDDITERGMNSVPGYYYRDDALALWDIIHSLVQGILENYYKTDAEVQHDSELQHWIHDIFEYGFLKQASSGVPQSLSSVDELVKFATMVIFTGSSQHAAVNAGQFDYGGWMPNSPTTLRRPPPTTKGSSTESTMLQTLPDQQTTAFGMTAPWLLSKRATDFVPLGHHPEEYFSEETPCKLMIKFRADLAQFRAAVHVRNQGLHVPYTYMDTDLVENSVAI